MGVVDLVVISTKSTLIKFVVLSVFIVILFVIFCNITHSRIEYYTIRLFGE